MAVDDDVRNDGMRTRWHLPFPFVSDPGGSRFLRSLELWNAEERGGLAIPAVLVIDANGNERFRATSRDFADRLHDEDALGALEAQAYSPIEPSAVPSPGENEPPMRGVFTPALFNPYFRGNFYGALALERRIADDGAKREAKAHRGMAKSFLDAWEARRAATEA